MKIMYCRQTYMMYIRNNEEKRRKKFGVGGKENRKVDEKQDNGVE